MFWASQVQYFYLQLLNNCGYYCFYVRPRTYFVVRCRSPGQLSLIQMHRKMIIDASEYSLVCEIPCSEEIALATKVAGRFFEFVHETEQGAC